MTYLLDTHYMLWAVTDTKKISDHIKNIITDPQNRIIVSAVSFWEVALKSSIGKLDISGFVPADLPGICETMGLEIINLNTTDSSTYNQLTATYHKDPFDRMLIWQAICNNYTLITADNTIKKYASEGLRYLIAK